MKNNEMCEVLLDRAYHSMKVRKLAIMLILAGMVICIIPLLPPVQKALFSFVDAHIPRKGAGGAFRSRLQSLLSLPFFGFVVFVLALCCLFSKNISAFLEDAKNSRLITILAAGTGVLLLCFVSIFSYKYGAQWLDSDHSSEMVLGKLLADENTFVSRNWHYSTEIRLIYQTIFIMPLFKLTGHYGNWALIRALAIFFNNLILILSYLFMAKQLKIQTKWIFITSLFLIIPISVGYWDIVTFGGYYVFFIVQLFCCLGLFIRLTDHAGTKKTIRIDFIFFIILSFALSLQGIRSLLCVHIPLFITCIYHHSKTAQKKKFPLFMGCCGFAICFVGFTSNYLLHFWYSFHSFDNMRLVNLYTEFFPKLGQSLVCLTEFFGLSTGNSLLSAQGLFSVIAIIGTFFLFEAVIKSFRQKAEYQFMPVFFIVSVIFNIFVFIIIEEQIIERYFIPFMVLYIPLIAILFQHTEKLYGHLKRVALVSGIILFICGQGYLNFQNLAGWDINSNRKGYMQYLLDNKLNYGFATYWEANVTTELTNGKVEMANLNPWNLSGLFVFKWLTPEKFYNPSFHKGESFILLTLNEFKELAQRTDRPFAQLQADYEDNNFIIFRFPSAKIIHSEILD